jgi:hypothetical protein|tara:strand:+ start:27 stop:236 length:210 start_codon:yes stop_codon:yes gene_type:complete
MKKKDLINIVNDGFIYFNNGAIDELTKDKKYYVRIFMEYIEYLEKKTFELNKKNKYNLNLRQLTILKQL